MGPRTSAALRDFQSKEGIEATGKPDKQTLASLGVDAKSGSGEPGKK
jgi:peptidoglycan hydrolase-like protein with peptidoglycan-binding domain